jgi:hypothetical protein
LGGGGWQDGGLVWFGAQQVPPPSQYRFVPQLVLRGRFLCSMKSKQSLACAGYSVFSVLAKTELDTVAITKQRAILAISNHFRVIVGLPE